MLTSSQSSDLLLLLSFKSPLIENKTHPYVFCLYALFVKNEHLTTYDVMIMIKNVILKGPFATQINLYEFSLVFVNLYVRYFGFVSIKFNVVKLSAFFKISSYTSLT